MLLSLSGDRCRCVGLWASCSRSTLVHFLIRARLLSQHARTITKLAIVILMDGTSVVITYDVIAADITLSDKESAGP